jgi:hypothetical protein
MEAAADGAPEGRGGAVEEARSGGHRRWRLAAAGGDGVDLGVAGLPEALRKGAPICRL